MKQVHAHKMIVEQARDLTRALYEHLMRDDKIRAKWRERFPDATEKQLEAKFLAMYVAGAIPAARSTLAGMLSLPIDEGLKEAIHEALCLDDTLKRGREAGHRVIG